MEMDGIFELFNQMIIKNAVVKEQESTDNVFQQRSIGEEKTLRAI